MANSNQRWAMPRIARISRSRIFLINHRQFVCDGGGLSVAAAVAVVFLWFVVVVVVLVAAAVW